MRKRNILQNYFSGPQKPNCSRRTPSELGINFIELFWLPKKLSSLVVQAIANRNVCTELEEHRLQLRPLVNRCILKRVLETKICAFFMFTGLTFRVACFMA